MVADGNGDIVLVNARTEKLFQYSRGELLGRPMEVLVPERLRGSRLFSDSRARPMDASLELRGQRKDGSEFPIEISQSPLQTEQGILVSSAIRDISGRKEAENRLHQAERVESLGRLAGGVAHDFNNLLNVILGYSELLSERFPAADPSRAQIDQITTAAARAADLTRQLLAYGRQQVLQPTHMNLNDTLGELTGMLRRLIPEDVEIAVRPGSSLWPMRADPTQMLQIVMNLAVNARDAMPDGGKLTIETANVVLDEDYARKHVPVVPGEYVLLTVTDTGIGMSPETKERIFDPFFTTKEMGKGTGLGLATVYGIVKQSEGFIWVYSEPGHGTSFQVHFPRREAKLAQQKLSARVPSRCSNTARTILVVEDNDQLREVAVKLLGSAGYRVLEASQPERALEIAKTYEGPIDLLLTDVVLPQISGRVLAEKLAALRPNTKFLFVSGYTDDVIMRHGISNGSVAFLQKPYTNNSLTSKIHEILCRASPSTNNSPSCMPD